MTGEYEPKPLNGPPLSENRYLGSIWNWSTFYSPKSQPSVCGQTESWMKWRTFHYAGLHFWIVLLDFTPPNRLIYLTYVCWTHPKLESLCWMLWEKVGGEKESRHLDEPDPGEAGDKERGRGWWWHSQDTAIGRHQKFVPSSTSGSPHLVLSPEICFSFHLWK